jgi:hypothetical protein
VLALVLGERDERLTEGGVDLVDVEAEVLERDDLASARIGSCSSKLPDASISTV